ncbi:MAG: NADH-quinone oxidoreductase subunit NuoF [Desulfobulbaceae bacterium]|nr:NADH-quinone oxidoreductase subunit NuoF [Desulfobulbaceae bacterium]
MNIERIASISTLENIRDKARASSPENGKSEEQEAVLLCAGGGCIASGAYAFKEALQSALNSQGLADKVTIIETGCLGPCAQGPVCVIGRDKTYYQGLQPTDAEELVSSHLKGNQIVERLTWKGEGEKPVPVLADIEFFKRQTKIVLRNCGRIVPTSLQDYIAHDGYAGLAKALTSMTPEQVIDEVRISGLRGRGGAGFPTHIKWTFTRNSEDPQKYILCNADEGDPGAYMDRSVLEGDPHSIVEGMALGAYAIGSSKGYVYVRAEYPLAIERLQIAIDAARQAGLLGKRILDTDFCFDVEIRMGSGAFVCGEETALINSIEGKRGEPRPRPPFPAVKGLWQKPSCLNNVETFANIPAIIHRGGAWYAGMGTEKSKGTKVFALAGAINVSGLVEVPIGAKLREIIYDIGGGIKGGGVFKAAQMGGPSGGCIPAAHLDVGLDYETLQSLGAIMGSGGMIVMDEHSCMVDVARFFLEFTQDESCGKCVPCREGTKRMQAILTKICAGEASMEDLDLLEDLASTVKSTSLCGLGQTAPNPVLSTLMHFRDEYVEHITDRKCRAHVCPALVQFNINDNCTGCTLCARRCPVQAISGEKKEKHVIDQSLCIKCGACLLACKFEAVDKQ